MACVLQRLAYVNCAVKFEDATRVNTTRGHRRLVLFQPHLSGTTCRVTLGPIRAASGSLDASAGAEFDPYKVLGVSPLDSFDVVKRAHSRRAKDAEAAGDEAASEQIERAYDRIMMLQLSRRKQGITFGSVKVSEEIKYADKASLVPWGPKYERSNKKTIMLNAAVSILMGVWAAAAQATEWKVLQILTSYYVFILFLKLDPFFPPSPEDDEKRWQRNGRRLLRALGLVFGCVAFTSLSHSALLSGLSFVGFYIPRPLLSLQEMWITLTSNLCLYIIGSYYR